MEIPGNIDPVILPILGVGCALLCVGLLVIGFLLQAIGGIVELVTGVIQAVMEILQGGPVAWCGCLLLILALLAAGGVVILYLNAPEACAAYPTHFCRWFGFIP